MGGCAQHGRNLIPAKTAPAKSIQAGSTSPIAICACRACPKTRESILETNLQFTRRFTMHVRLGLLYQRSENMRAFRAWGGTTGCFAPGNPPYSVLFSDSKSEGRRGRGSKEATGEATKEDCGRGATGCLLWNSSSRLPARLAALALDHDCVSSQVSGWNLEEGIAHNQRTMRICANKRTPGRVQPRARSHGVRHQPIEIPTLKIRSPTMPWPTVESSRDGSENSYPWHGGSRASTCSSVGRSKRSISSGQRN